MALEDIFRALEEQAQKERESILSAARAQADAIIEDATEQAEGVCAECVDKVGTAAGIKAATRLNAANLEAKKQVAAVKDDAVAQVFENAAQKLAALRGSDRYAEVFRALAAEALSGAEGEVVLLVDPDDEQLAGTVASALGVDAEVRPELSTTGGLSVLTGGGRITRRNTFEDRLEKVQQTVQSEVAEILFP